MAREITVFITLKGTGSVWTVQETLTDTFLQLRQTKVGSLCFPADVIGTPFDRNDVFVVIDKGNHHLTSLLG